MKKRISMYILTVFSIAIISIALTTVLPVQKDKKDRSARIAQVLDNVWDEYGFFSFQIGDTDPTLWIIMDETKSEEKLMTYLKENLSRSDLEHYRIEILKKSLEEHQNERTMNQISDMIQDYIKEKDYQNISLAYPSVDKTTGLLTVNNASEIANEDLKKEFEELVINNSGELSLVDNFSYDIEVITPIE